MKIDKAILSKIAATMKDYPMATILGGIGGTFGLLLMLSMGGLGYMMDTKNDVIENIIENKEEN